MILFFLLIFWVKVLPFFFLVHTILARGDKMIQTNLIQELFIIASINGAICVSFIQKIKKHIHCSKCIPYYSFAINILLAVLFCISFTNISFPMSLWVGLFSYIGADTLYKSLEGKLATYSSLTKKEEKVVDDLEEISYD